MNDFQNYGYADLQSRRHNVRPVNAKSDCKDKFLDDLKNCSHHREIKLKNLPSYDCPFQSSMKHAGKDYRATVSDQQLEMAMHPRKLRNRKSRSPLTYPHPQKHQNFSIDDDLYSTELRGIDRCPGKCLEKSRKKIKEELSQDCNLEVIEDDEIMRGDRNRGKRDKGKWRAPRCLKECEDLDKEIWQFEWDRRQEKNFTEQRKRNCVNRKMCPKLLCNDSNLDEEEANRILEEDVAKIRFCEPCIHPKRVVKTPETTTSVTETSIAEETNGWGQSNVQKENPLGGSNHLQDTRERSASSEASASENDEDREDTLLASPRIDEGKLQCINYLTDLRWQYLSLTQAYLDRLCKLEQTLEKLTTNNAKSGESRNVDKGRHGIRTPALHQ